MRNEARGDVWKLWLYAAASVALGAWLSPWLYNAGKALAEVSRTKTTNGFLEWLAGLCREADFPGFYAAAMLLAAGLLFFPWMEWVRARIFSRDWLLRKWPRGLWHACAGFLLVAGLLLAMGVALVPAGFATLRNPAHGMAQVALKSLPAAFALAVVMEAVFRGVATGVFLRAMRPALALGMSAVFFALALTVMLPAAGVTVADPDASGTGFELLGNVAAGFAGWRHVIGYFVPLVALGGLLAHARWRTESLWLPVGLHTGWLFSQGFLAKLSAWAGAPFPAGGLLQQAFVPLVAILAAGVAAHFLTANHDDKGPAHS